MGPSLPVNTGDSARMVVIDKGSDSAMFSRVDGSASAGSVLEVEAVKAIVERIASGMGIGIPAIVHADEAALFSAEPQIAKQAKEDGAEGEVRAAYFKGKVHVVASMFGNEKDVELSILDALAHEGQGNYGIRSMHGHDADAIRKALVGVYAAFGGDKGFSRIAEKAGIDMSPYLSTATTIKDQSARTAYLADEFLVLMQGKAATASIPARVMNALRAYVGKVREWLRASGFKRLSDGSDADLAFLLSRMREAAKTGIPGHGEKARFSRSEAMTGVKQNDDPAGKLSDEGDTGGDVDWDALPSVTPRAKYRHGQEILEHGLKQWRSAFDHDGQGIGFLVRDKWAKPSAYSDVALGEGSFLLEESTRESINDQAGRLI